ncbi:hypothetical protein ACWEKR_14805, partial [Nocardia sp. NPDC004573]
PAQLKTETTNPTGQVVQIELPSDGPDWRSVDRLSGRRRAIRRAGAMASTLIVRFLAIGQPW